MTEEERRRFFEDFNTSLIELQKDPEAWKVYQEELRIWDATLADGLPEDEIWDPITRTAQCLTDSQSREEP